MKNYAADLTCESAITALVEIDPYNNLIFTLYSQNPNLKRQPESVKQDPQENQ